MRAAIQWCSVGVVAATFGALLIMQQRQLQRLRGEVDGLRAVQRAAERSMAEAEKVEEARFDLTRIRPEADELPRLRADLAALKAKFRQMEQADRKKAAPLNVRNLAASDWSNAGRATPQATLETALWAAAAGELDLLAETLVFDERGRGAAEQLLRNLPQETRAQYQKPERLIALLAAKDVPASTVAAQVSELPSERAEDARLRVKLQDASGATRTARLTLRPMAGRWNVVISDRDVDRLAANLKR